MLFHFIFRSISTHTKPYLNPHFRYNGMFSFTTSTFSPSSNQYSFTRNYLINSCGLSPKSALLVSKDLDLSKSLNKPDSVLEFFKNQGFTDSQVSKLISRHPKVLLTDIENTLLPRFNSLKSLGFSSKDIAAIVTVAPKGLLRKRPKETVLPCVSYLRSVLGSDDKVICAIKRHPLILTYDLKVYGAENIRFLLEQGVPEENIAFTLAHQPRTFLTSVDRFKKIVENVKEMGFNPSKTRFLLAIQAVRGMSRSTWDNKLELYKKWGLSEDDIFLAFERCPGFMMASVDKISGILDFLVNTMGWEKSLIVQWPIVMCFSLEKRIIPRCLLYQYLGEKGLTEKDDFCFNKWLMYTENKFLKFVVKRYEDEGPELLKLYQKHLDEANRSTTSTPRKTDLI
uniref:transcription termination factor MTEF18, mitochondrial-like n=1 Tax=Erigeron canadensis TaxID=72917 RepID=UPI001CB9A3F9|nr:transcription termination factor MTEF18, mitochondrial-like [Erigeron canadensis]